MRRNRIEQYETATCPFCGHIHSVLVDQRGQASARVAAQVGIGLHKGKCPARPIGFPSGEAGAEQDTDELPPEARVQLPEQPSPDNPAK
jgi:hypothetical protein